MIRKFKCFFVVLLGVLVFSFSCFGVSSASVDTQFGLNHYIEMNTYYLYIPDNYLEFIQFNKDGIMYFSSSNTVTCFLIFKGGSSNLNQVVFPSIYQGNNNYNYRNISDYYTERVSVGSAGTLQQHLQPIYYDNIIDTDINFNHDIPNLLNGLILIFIVVGDILSVFLIFSNKRRLAS